MLATHAALYAFDVTIRRTGRAAKRLVSRREKEEGILKEREGRRDQRAARGEGDEVG